MIMQKTVSTLSMWFFLLSFLFSGTLVAQDQKLKILLPLYSYPEIDNNSEWVGKEKNPWKKVADAQSDIDLTVIINPFNGPVSPSTKIINTDPGNPARLELEDISHVYRTYKAAIGKLKTAKLSVMAYVSMGRFKSDDYLYRKLSHNDESYLVNKHDVSAIVEQYPFINQTSFSTLTQEEIIANIKAEVDTYINHYVEGIDGIFFDEVATNDYLNLREVYTYIKRKKPCWTVILNPGERVPANYLDDQAPAGDVVITAEKLHCKKVADECNPPNSNCKYWFDDVSVSINTQAWPLQKSPEQFACIIHTAPKERESYMKTAINKARGLNFGYVYITDQGQCNSSRFGSLPTYWSQEVAYIKQLNETYSPAFLKVPTTNKAKDIAVGSNGELYIISSDNKIYKFDQPNNKWINQPIDDWTPKRIAVAPNGNLWVINTLGYILQRKENGKWDWEKSGKGAGGNSIAIGADGSIFVTAKWNYETNYKLFKLIDNRWVAQAPQGRWNFPKPWNPVEVAVQGDGSPWILNGKDGHPFKRNASCEWEWQSGVGNKIAVGGGRVYLIGTDRQLYWHNKGTWKMVKTISGLKNLSADQKGNLWVSKTGSLELYKTQ